MPNRHMRSLSFCPFLPFLSCSLAAHLHATLALYLSPTNMNSPPQRQNGVSPVVQLQEEDVPLAHRRRPSSQEAPACSPLPMSTQWTHPAHSPIRTLPTASQPKGPKLALAQKATAKPHETKQVDASKQQTGRPPLPKPAVPKQTTAAPGNKALAAASRLPMASSAALAPPGDAGSRRQAAARSVPEKTLQPAAAASKEAMGPPPARKRPALPDRSSLPPKKRRATAAATSAEGHTAQQAVPPDSTRHFPDGRGAKASGSGAHTGHPVKQVSCQGLLDCCLHSGDPHCGILDTCPCLPLSLKTCPPFSSQMLHLVYTFSMPC